MRRILAAAACLAMLGVLTSGRPAAAAGRVNEPFGLTPMAGTGNAAGYFELSMAPGQSLTESAFLSNPGQTTKQLKMSRSTGGTAANGGTTFVQAFRNCSGPGCWITGLPSAVTLPPGTGERLQFQVSVPRRTAPGQYLAGVTAEVAAAPPPVKIGSNGKATGKVTIIEQVTVAVAVTVGSLPALTTRLAVPGVSATLIGPTVRLNIGLKNIGQTFAHGAVSGTCADNGKRHRFAAYASTVLPDEQALIAANLTGAPEGVTMQCAVRLAYGRGQIATWSGPVIVPDASTSRIVHTAPGAYSVVPSEGIPAWATALIVIGVLILAAAVVLLVRVRSRGQA